jgi:hypothetical protein
MKSFLSSFFLFMASLGEGAVVGLMVAVMSVFTLAYFYFKFFF